MFFFGCVRHTYSQSCDVSEVLHPAGAAAAKAAAKVAAPSAELSREEGGNFESMSGL